MPSRLASSKKFRDALSEALVPWAERGDPTKPGPSYMGRNQYDFVEDTRAIDRMIRGAFEKGNPGWAEQWLIDNRGYTDDEAIRTLQEIDPNVGWQRQRRNQVTDEPMLRQRAMGVPNTLGDENLSALLLNNSNFQDVEGGNKDNMFATDLFGYVDGQRVGIDAQTRTRPDEALTLGMLGGVQGAGNVARMLKGSPNKRLIDALTDLQRGGAYEGKLLDTIDDRFNREPGRRLLDNIDQYRKDYIISSNRAVFNPSMREQGLQDRNQGPYNPTKPMDWALIDMADLRNDVLNSRVSDLLGSGYDITGYNKSKKLNLLVPRREILRLNRKNGQLDPDIVRAMSVPLR